MSVGSDSMYWIPVKFPNLSRATIIAQRSAAQKGQYSAPMYRTSGLPLSVRGEPEIEAGARMPDPLPTWFNVFVLTPERSLRTVAETGVPQREQPVLAVPDWVKM